MTTALRRAVVVLTAAVLGSVVPTILVAPPASAATVSRPHAGAWHFVNNNGSVHTARVTISKHGTYASKISVRPSARGCQRTAVATISGKFRVRATSGTYRWKVGSTLSAQAPVRVTIHQSGVKRSGYLFIGFSSRTKGLGELEPALGHQQGTCDLYFGLRS